MKKLNINLVLQALVIVIMSVLSAQAQVDEIELPSIDKRVSIKNETLKSYYENVLLKGSVKGVIRKVYLGDYSESEERMYDRNGKLISEESHDYYTTTATKTGKIITKYKLSESEDYRVSNADGYVVAGQYIYKNKQLIEYTRTMHDLSKTVIKYVYNKLGYLISKEEMIYESFENYNDNSVSIELEPSQISMIKVQYTKSNQLKQVVTYYRNESARYLTPDELPYDSSTYYTYTYNEDDLLVKTICKSYSNELTEKNRNRAIDKQHYTLGKPREEGVTFFKYNVNKQLIIEGYSCNIDNNFENRDYLMENYVNSSAESDNIFAANFKSELTYNTKNQLQEVKRTFYGSNAICQNLNELLTNDKNVLISHVVLEYDSIGNVTRYKDSEEDVKFSYEYYD